MTQSSAGEPRNVEYPPVRNAMDYLESVLGHLRGQPEPRDLKYAVLHLQAATELILKTRLVQEHWSLVFKDPGRADRARFDNGDFETCTTAEAIARLRGVVGLDIPASAEDELKKLANWRNALQHYGLSVPAPAVETRAGRILDFLMAFVTEHLLEHLSEDELDAEVLDTVTHALATAVEIKSFAKARLNRLRPILVPYAEVLVDCFSCGMPTMVVAAPSLECHFCLTTESARVAHYLRSYRIWDVDTCPNCKEFARLEHPRRSAPEAGPICLACGTPADRTEDEAGAVTG